MKQKLWFSIFLVLLLIVLFCCSALADSSGTCGDNLTWTLDDNGVLTISGTGDMSDYTNELDPPWDLSTVKQVIIEQGVTSIGDFAFDGCIYMTSVTIPNGVTSIGDYAFRNCDLTSVDIPNGLSSIGFGAFYSCHSLTGMTIPNSVTSIDAYVFMDCRNLTNVTLSNNLTEIRGSTFNSCRNLTSVTIPNSVTYIGAGAFAACSSLTSVTIPDSVIDISFNAFQDCSSLESITIPNNVYSIGEGAFLWCSSLTNVIIQDGVSVIDGGAFMECTNLTSVTIPKSVTSIGDSVFANCSNDLTIYCYSGSTAHQYAKENNLKFSLLDTPEQSWNEPTYTWSEDNSKVTARRVAKDDSSVMEEETVKTTRTEKAPLTKQENGYKRFIPGEIKFTAIFNNPAFTKQTRYIEIGMDTKKDTDGDGLPDSWEKYGFDYDGDSIIDVDLPAMGADSNVPDLFVEIDYMYQKGKIINASGHSISEGEIDFKPNKDALKLVCEQFNKHGIKLHVDAGSDSVIDYTTGKNNEWGNLSRSNVLEYRSNIDTDNDWKNIIDSNFDRERKSCFRYCIYIDHYDSTDSSGLAQISGQYFLVADTRSGSSNGVLSSVSMEAGTFMHELGHTLGLLHGGDENTNYKPNYLSVMNYLYQFTGLDIINGVFFDYSDGLYFNYSEYTLPSITSNSISEELGLDYNGVSYDKKGVQAKWRYSFYYDDQGELHFLLGYSDKAICWAPIDFNKNGIIDKAAYKMDFFLEAFDGDVSSVDYVKESINDWNHLKLRVGNIGIGLMGLKNQENQSMNVVKEISLEDAKKNGILGNRGDCGFISITPGTLYSNVPDQFIFVEIENLFPEPTSAQLSAHSDILSNVYSATISLSGNEQKTVMIPIKNNLGEGNYTFDCELLDENGNTITNNIKINVFDAPVLQMVVGETKDFIEDEGEEVKLISEKPELASVNNYTVIANKKGTVFVQVLNSRDLLLARIPVEIVDQKNKTYFVFSGEGMIHIRKSGKDEVIVVKSETNDENTFSLFKEIQIDEMKVESSNYVIEAGSLIIKFKSSYLDELSKGQHTLKVIFEDGFVETNFSISGNSFEDIAIPSDSFTFKKVWEGDSEKSIDFTLYKADGSVYHHGFDKKIVSNKEWKYNAYFSAPAACYVIEQPIPGYITKYVNVGVYANVTDRCCDGGTIINKKIPKTGDTADFALWAGAVLVGVIGLTTTVILLKRRKAQK